MGCEIIKKYYFSNIYNDNEDICATGFAEQSPDLETATQTNGWWDKWKYGFQVSPQLSMAIPLYFAAQRSHFPLRPVLGGAAALGALAFGLYFFYSHKKEQVWVESKSARDVAQIATCIESKDWKALDEIENRARKRHEKIEKAIQSAQSKGENRIDNRTHDSVAHALCYAAFDMLVATRADLNKNRFSKDPQSRIGITPLSRWSSRLAEEDQIAMHTGFEGNLALQIDTMTYENNEQHRTIVTLSRYISDFKGEVPAFFAATMSAQLLLAQSELKEFQTNEVEAEELLARQVTATMRQRVSARLYSERPDYREHLDRRERLQSLLASKVEPAANTARYIDHQLSEVISHRRSESHNLILAEQNRHVPVRKSRSVRCADGKSTNCSESYTDYEDQSFMYRAMAQADADAAEACAKKTKAEVDQLKPLIAGLKSDNVIRDEKLLEQLPQGGQIQDIHEGQGVASHWILPPLVSLFASVSSEGDASRARSEFSPVLASLIEVEKQVSDRHTSEVQWVNMQIDADVARQKTIAAERLKKT